MPSTLISPGKILCLILLGIVLALPISAQRGEEAAFEEIEWIDWTGKEKPRSYLVIQVDTDCIVTLDAGQGVSVNAGEEIHVWYPGGTHTIEAVSNDGTLTFRQELKIKKKKQEFLMIALNPDAEVDGDGGEPDVVNWDGREKPHAFLNIEVDTDAKITMDGIGEFRLRAGEDKQVWYPKGKHMIEAVSLSGDLTWNQEVKMKGGKQQTIMITLNPEQDNDGGDQTNDDGVRVVYWDNDSPPHTTINMKTDTDCKVTIDGEGEFQLNVGEEIVVWYPKGKHDLEATSISGDLVWNRELKMKKNKQEMVSIEMQGSDAVLADEGTPDDVNDSQEDIYDQEEPFDMSILENMVLVEAGQFLMGDKMGEPDEMPRHMVRLKDFYIDKFEVTNGQYAAFMTERGINVGGDPWIEIENEYCQIKKKGKKYVALSGYENHPVVKVTWYGAEVYAEWAGKRLPTEAEWEYAARGGKYSQGFKYAGGDHLDVVAWFNNNTLGETRPVGSKLPNELGLYDMTGNVWEWCQDWYGDKYYENSPKDSPVGPGHGEFRILRGGSAKGNVVDGSLRISNRNWNKPEWGNYLHGFRCVLDVPKDSGSGRK